MSRRLLPFLFLVYVVNFLDRVNVSFAALQMNRDLGFSATVYGFGAGVFFVGYVLCGVPSNALLLRVGVRRWVGGLMVAWGLVSGLTALVHRPWEFYLLRALLGVAEAGFFPALIFYLSRWYPLGERARAVARCMIAVPLAGVIGGPLSGAILGLDGTLGVAGWRWLFLLEALPAVVLGLVTWARLPEGPRDAAWLSPGERDLLAAAIADDSAGATPMSRHTMVHFPPVLWVLSLIWFGVVLVGYGWNLWLPQVLAERSHGTVLTVGWLAALSQLAGIPGALWFADRSDRKRERRLPIAIAAAMVVLGLFGLALSSGLWAGVAAFALMAAGQCGLWGPFWTLPGEQIRGPALATAVAIINSIGNIGGFLGPWLMGVLRDRTASYEQGFLVLAAIQIVAVLLAAGLWRRGRVTVPA
ncbi:MAG TPA: MFS transporter [Gemmatimonadales bacterium]|nr:MFS transporter [Gemmatimonadales bacterium]